MQILKESVRVRIIDGALTEFANKGYEKSSMQSVAKYAGIAVGNIYHYYKSKSDLFYSLTTPVLNRIVKLFANAHVPDFSDGDRLSAFIVSLGSLMSSMIKKHRRELLILISGSKGTRHENARDKLISVLEKKIIREYKNLFENRVVKIREPFIVHIFATNIIEGYAQIILHYKNDEWVDNVSADFISHSLNGFSIFFGV